MNKLLMLTLIFLIACGKSSDSPSTPVEPSEPIENTPVIIVPLVGTHYACNFTGSGDDVRYSGNKVVITEDSYKLYYIDPSLDDTCVSSIHYLIADYNYTVIYKEGPYSVLRTFNSLGQAMYLGTYKNGKTLNTTKCGSFSSNYEEIVNELDTLDQINNRCTFTEF